MSAGFPLDASSFEKLLAAAWVLQCEQDEKTNTRDRLDASHLLLDRTVASASEAVNCHEHEAYPALKDALAPETSPRTQVDAPVAMLERSEDPSSSSAAEPLPVEVTSARHPAVITALHVMATAAEDQAMAEIGRWFSAVLVAIQSRTHRFQSKTVRLVVSSRSLRLARVSVAPILLLFVMFAFSLSQVWKQKAAQASQRAELQSLPSAAADSLQVHETRFAESLMLHEDEIRNQELTNQRSSTHLHITDSSTASAVEALSPYEVAGLRRQAEYGDQSAALALGMAYETGHSVRQSCTKAAEWIAFAAANDNPAAEYNLGLRYFQGDGLPQDPTEGAKWLAKAMAAGYPKVLTAEKHPAD